MSSSSDDYSLFQVLGILLDNYRNKTPTKVKVIDLFMLYQLATAAVLSLYCGLVGSFPKNAFLAGLFASLGCFVLTVSLRKQVNKDTKKEFEQIFEERAYSDFVIGSLLLFFTCVAFMG